MFIVPHRNYIINRHFIKAEHGSGIAGAVRFAVAYQTDQLLVKIFQSYERVDFKAGLLGLVFPRFLREPVKFRSERVDLVPADGKPGRDPVSAVVFQ